MASVTSLDQDMRNLRMSRYTPQAANEVRTWIEETLGERLPPGDLLEALKDGVILCRLANLALPPPGIKFKKSSMPFMQMENISHFLRACEQPPLSMPAHDRFLTVDLYESKDPAQVLQCLGAFSRVASAATPRNFPTTIGPKKTGVVSPTATGPSNGSYNTGFNRSRGTSGVSNSSYGGSSTFNPVSRPAEGRVRALSPTLTGGSNASKTTEGGIKSTSGSVSSWSRKTDEGVTSPAWNIHQYGYMGGASQGNQGISFGARRQITSAGPHVPSLAEKERMRREKQAEEERLRLAAEEAEAKRLIEREAEEERARIDEEQRWEEESQRQREAEKARLEMQKREWEEEERKWRAEEEARKREEKEELARMERDTKRGRTKSDARLQGQFLSQYQAEQSSQNRTPSREDPERAAERERIRNLEMQLEEAKQRELQYQREREERLQQDRPRPLQRHGDMPTPPRDPSPKDSEVSWVTGGDERELLRTQWSQNHAGAPRPLPDPNVVGAKPALPARPLPDPGVSAALPAASPSRPLPNPADYNFPSQTSAATVNPTTRASRFLASNPAPPPKQVRNNEAPELTSTNERAAEDARRLASQQKTKNLGWASKSLLEREMEKERERQREWEEAQKESAKAARDIKEGTGEGQSWDVNQYGWMGGDSQNRGGSGIGFGGRRQIIGPRSMK